MKHWLLSNLPPAAVLRRLCILRMKWTSSSDAPSMRAASISWGRITSRSSCSPFRLPASRKRFVYLFFFFQNSNVTQLARISCAIDALSAVLQEDRWSYWGICGLRSLCFLLHLFHPDHHFPKVSSRDRNCFLDPCPGSCLSQFPRDNLPRKSDLGHFMRS